MNLLQALLEAQTADVPRIIKNNCQKFSKHLTSGKHWTFIRNPKSPMLLVAHIDTVRRSMLAPTLKVHDPGKNIIRADGVLGADDRAGVYAAIRILHTAKEFPNVLFTDLEESGGGGMVEFCDEHEYKDVQHIHLAIALDRAHANDFVTYNYLPREVQEYVESFGFIEQAGSFNDIEIFSDETDIPSVNVSIGYYYQHSEKEKLHVDELKLTIQRVTKMVDNPIEKQYLIPENKKFLNWNSRYSSYTPDSGYDKDVFYDNCELCGIFTKIELYEEDPAGQDYVYACSACAAQYNLTSYGSIEYMDTYERREYEAIS